MATLIGWLLFASIISAAPGASPDALALEHAGARGTLRIALAEVAPFEVVEIESAPDVLYPRGRMLARLGNEEGAAVTISFDETHRLSAAERRAFLEVAEEQAASSSSTHAVRRHGRRDWVYQVFAAPGDFAVTAQTFVQGHPLAIVFWLPRGGPPPLEDPRVTRIMADLQIVWGSTPKQPKPDRQAK